MYLILPQVLDTGLQLYMVPSLIPSVTFGQNHVLKIFLCYLNMGCSWIKFLKVSYLMQLVDLFYLFTGIRQWSKVKYSTIPLPLIALRSKA